jgi:hypothetical protein
MASPVEAMRAIVSVRWPLLESYALARQDGLAEPVGFVIDRSYSFAKELASQLLVGHIVESASPSVTCMERGALAGMLTVAAPDLAKLLRGAADQPGRWVALLLAQQGWLLTGTWQELMMAEERSAAEPGRSRAR